MGAGAVIAGLYAVTPDGIDEPRLLARTLEALEGGARVVQYRDKGGDAARRLRLAQRLRAACLQHAALFIVNDDVELAAAIAADGVHLGRDDAAIEAARARLGPDALIGASCYDELERAQRAVHAGASYLAFGSFFPSRVKPAAVRPPLAILAEARSLGRPLVAIGGIDLGNAATLLAAGADALAVVSALYDAPDTAAAARGFSRLFAHAAPALP
jgi:thiamine-phosphate pyrophosphorylase